MCCQPTDTDSIRLPCARPGSSNGVTLAPALVKETLWNAGTLLPPLPSPSPPLSAAAAPLFVVDGAAVVLTMVSLKPSKKHPGSDAGIST